MQVVRRLCFGVVLVLVLSVMSGCSFSPEARKKKHLEKAQSYFDQGKYRESLIEYENAIQIDPKSSEAHFGLAQCLLKETDLPHAYQELMSAVEYDPTNWKAQLQLGNLLLLGHHNPEARDRGQTVLKGDPGNVDAQTLIAAADAAGGNLTQAIAEAQTALQMDPNRASSYMLMAELQERNNDPAAAEQSYQKTTSLNPTSAAALITFGSFYQRQHRWADAQKQFQAAIVAAPQDPAPRAALAKLYLDQGQKDMAERVLREASTTIADNPAGYEMLGDFYLTQGDLSKAAAEFEALHAKHPKELSVTKTYVNVLLFQNRLDDAVHLTDAILKDSPSDPDGLTYRGEILTRQGKASDAIPILESAVKSAPNSAFAHFQLGVAYAANGNLGQAQSEWQQASTLRPNMVEPQRALAMLAARKSDPTSLVQSSEQLMRLEPHSAEGYVFHSRALLLKGDKAGAEADLKKAIEVAPRDSTAFVRMGDLRASAKQYDDAAKFYSQALTLNPSSAEALAGLVGVDLVHNQLAQALQRVQAQIARVPDSSVFYVQLGQLEQRNHDPGKAEEAFEKATELDKNNAVAFMLLAETQASRGSIDQAIARYQQAIQASPKDPRPHVLLGLVYETRGDWQQAEDQYQRALQAQPDYPVAANNLSYLMLEHSGDVSVALSLAQTARRMLPNLPTTADTLGWAYYNQGAYPSAVDALKEAVSGDDKNPTYHYHLGMAYQKTNNYAMARKELESALQLDPKYAHADEIRRALSGTPAAN